MREDMFKVIVERPRGGRRRAVKSKLRYVKGDGRRRITGKRIVTEYNGHGKWLNENLAPLKRYLHKQKGRKWDDVFSDICANLDTGSTVKMHVREHIDDFIEVNIRVDASGDYWASGRWGSPQPPRQWSDLYVDPVDGVVKDTAQLCRRLGVPTSRQYWKQRRLSDAQRCGKHKCLRKISDTVYLVQKDGIWYKYQLAALPVSPYGFKYCHKELYGRLCQATWHEDMPWRVIAKQQLSSKDLRKHGLTNAGGCYG